MRTKVEKVLAIWSVAGGNVEHEKKCMLALRYFEIIAALLIRILWPEIASDRSYQRMKLTQVSNGPKDEHHG